MALGQDQGQERRRAGAPGGHVPRGDPVLRRRQTPVLPAAHPGRGFPGGRAAFHAPDENGLVAGLRPDQVERPRPLDLVGLHQPLCRHPQGAQGPLRALRLGPGGPEIKAAGTARPCEEGTTVLFAVKVQPRSKSPGVEKLGGGELRVRVLAAPEKGRANREVIARLAEYLDVAPSRLKIVRGEASSRKTVRLE
ncbi:MAG: DUF167 domain-containing protein [Candidatus Aminicenantes bacterium]|nr:DUF167 domain-containing protein [Candidatus Aminicenantes bacterium]